MKLLAFSLICVIALLTTPVLGGEDFGNPATAEACELSGGQWLLQPDGTVNCVMRG